MTEEEFAASVPVCVEMVPTVMELAVTPGAPADDVAAPEPSGTNSALTANATPVTMVPATVRHPHLDRMPTPRTIVGRRGAGRNEHCAATIDRRSRGVLADRVGAQGKQDLRT